jgi:hypothetical protein
LPPDMTPPSSPPAGLPDLASPGFWAYIYIDEMTKTGWIQTALNSGPDHKPYPPTKGLPGEWAAVYSSSQADSTHAWLPTEPPVVQPVAPAKKG